MKHVSFNVPAPAAPEADETPSIYNLVKVAIKEWTAKKTERNGLRATVHGLLDKQFDDLIKRALGITDQYGNQNITNNGVLDKYLSNQAQDLIKQWLGENFESRLPKISTSLQHSVIENYNKLLKEKLHSIISATAQENAKKLVDAMISRSVANVIDPGAFKAHAQPFSRCFSDNGENKISSLATVLGILRVEHAYIQSEQQPEGGIQYVSWGIDTPDVEVAYYVNVNCSKFNKSISQEIILNEDQKWCPVLSLKSSHSNGEHTICHPFNELAGDQKVFNHMGIGDLKTIKAAIREYNEKHFIDGLDHTCEADETKSK